MKLRPIVAVVFAAALSLTACSKEEVQKVAQEIAGEASQAISEGVSSSGSGAAEGFEFEDDAVKVTEDTTFYNDYLGVSFALPSGWWIYSCAEDNFAESEGLTGDLSSLDIVKDDGYIYMDLLSCANLQYSNKDNHVGVDLFAEQIDGLTNVEEYKEDYLDFFLEPYEDESYELVNEETVEINGREYVKCSIDVERESSPYNIILLFTEMDDDFFLTAHISYWPENKDLIDQIIEEKIVSNMQFN